MQAPGALLPDLTCQLHTLDNGLRVVLHREPSLPLVAVNLWYHVGSKNERPGRTGFAHLFEHMLFQGSANVPIHEHFRQVQRVGGVLNGSTWYDRTNYYETLPAHHLELGLWLESDRMGFLLPAVTQQNLDTQRDVVMNERRQRVENQPYGRATERLHELLYPADHPYHWPVIGYLDDIAAASLEEVRDFCRTYYTPNNAVLTVAGDIDPAAALALVERWFGDIPRGPEPPPVDAADLPPLASERREDLPDDIRLARVYFGFRAPRYGDARWYAGDLLAGVLTAGKSSVLYRDLVYRRQLAQEVGVHLDPTELAGTFYVVATAKPGIEPEALDRGAVRAPRRRRRGAPRAGGLRAGAQQGADRHLRGAAEARPPRRPAVAVHDLFRRSVRAGARGRALRRPAARGAGWASRPRSAVRSGASW